MPVSRPKDIKNRKLERYLKRDKNGYITYKHPKMQESRGLGHDTLEANEIARQCNAALSDQRNTISRILNGGVTFNEVLDRYLRDRAPGRPWSASYRAEVERKIEKFRSRGDAVYQATDVLFFDELVESTFAITSRKAAISLLRDIDKFAIGKGLRPPVFVCDGILPPEKQHRKRSRIKTMDEYNAIFKLSPTFLQLAMDVSLITLQPREVICVATLPRAAEPTWKVIRGKTNQPIEIQVGECLAAAFQRCRIEAMRLGSRMLICRQPERIKKVRGDAFKVKPELITRTFTESAISTGIWSENHPTFHEIRSFGAHLYEKAGVPKEHIQALMGHQKPETTDIYLRDHEPVFMQAASR